MKRNVRDKDFKKHSALMIMTVKKFPMVKDADFIQLMPRSIIVATQTQKT